ncbi:hypothetical protein [Roseofilum capinflatum]|uniref:Uncharacterized protein n=1 Tax=Roseofilum capinflatum BLCC-M114 TaxID=3022440 RepID=A0ABT7B6V6_9CYAN|nr:hypothetical protein [Roseofilum capinflatum]MDJ1174888.1 hypothetical protein [Roseofilum capinflatum BLCC-M114]
MKLKKIGIGFALIAAGAIGSSVAFNYLSASKAPEPTSVSETEQITNLCDDLYPGAGFSVFVEGLEPFESGALAGDSREFGLQNILRLAKPASPAPIDFKLNAYPRRCDMEIIVNASEPPVLMEGYLITYSQRDTDVIDASGDVIADAAAMANQDGYEIGRRIEAFGLETYRLVIK